MWAGPVELKPVPGARLLPGVALALAVLLAWQSMLPAWQVAVLLVATLACVLALALPAHDRALRCVQLDPQREQLHWCTADGRRCTALFAGHALVGTLAIILYVERVGWRRLAGPRALLLPRAAMDADDFRRLRAWLVLGGGRLG